MTRGRPDTGSVPASDNNPHRARPCRWGRPLLIPTLPVQPVVRFLSAVTQRERCLVQNRRMITTTRPTRVAVLNTR